DIYLKKVYTSEKLPNKTFLERATHNHFKGRGHVGHHSYLFFTLTKNRALNNAKYVNPLRSLSKTLTRELDDNIKAFMASVGDAVAFVNNARKIVLSPMDREGILELTKAQFNGYNDGFDTDMLLEKSGIHIGDSHFDVLAVNNVLCFGESVQSSRTNEKFTSDDFTF